MKIKINKKDVQSTNKVKISNIKKEEVKKSDTQKVESEKPVQEVVKDTSVIASTSQPSPTQTTSLPQQTTQATQVAQVETQVTSSITQEHPSPMTTHNQTSVSNTSTSQQFPSMQQTTQNNQQKNIQSNIDKAVKEATKNKSSKRDNTLKLVALIFCGISVLTSIIGLILGFIGFYVQIGNIIYYFSVVNQIFPLIVSISTFALTFGIWKGKIPNKVPLDILIFFFGNIIAGILLFMCKHDKK